MNLVGGVNGDPVDLFICLCMGDSQEHISSAMNTIIFILHFRLSNTRETFLALLLISFSFTAAHFCINLEVVIMTPCLADADIIFLSCFFLLSFFLA